MNVGMHCMKELWIVKWEAATFIFPNEKEIQICTVKCDLGMDIFCWGLFKFVQMVWGKKYDSIITESSIIKAI